jgi:hypothetical protein
VDPFAFQSHRYRILWVVCHTAATVDVPHLYSISVLFLARRNEKSICELVDHAQSLVR